MKKISVLAYCYNEEENVKDLFLAVQKEFKKLPKYQFELVYIDNASTDKTVEVLRKLSKTNPEIKVIVNRRNYGHIRSPFYGLLQTTGDASVFMASDLQDPPSLIPSMIKEWEKGNEMVFCVRRSSEESFLMFQIRSFYYWLVAKISETTLIRNFNGFGLYDQKVVRLLGDVNEPYPYLRGLLLEVSDSYTKIEYDQPLRKKGKTKNNFYSLYDSAIFGIISYSKLPLRIAVFFGMAVGIFSFLIAMVYLILKLVFWDLFTLGSAPLLIGTFFLASVQLVFIGILGEYLSVIFTQVKKRPLVLEKERINF